MASIVGLCNRALVAIGAETITAITDGGNNANACNEVYEDARDEMLRAHPWNFAVARAKLGRLAEAPAFGFRYAYQLPSDWLRTISVHGDEAGVATVRHKHEGRAIHSDAADIYLRYIRRITDVNMMDAMFRTALSIRIALDVVDRVAHSESKVARVAKQFEQALRAAKSVDSQEDQPDEIPAGSWIAAR